MDQFVAEANELSTGETYEGLLDEHGSVPEAGTPPATWSPPPETTEKPITRPSPTKGGAFLKE